LHTSAVVQDLLAVANVALVVGSARGRYGGAGWGGMERREVALGLSSI
jgi:hypothetical protein